MKLKDFFATLSDLDVFLLVMINCTLSMLDLSYFQ